MKRFFSALIRSFSLYLFLVLVCGASVALVTIPAVGQRVAAPLCEGVVASETENFSLPNGESGVNVAYVCVAENGERSAVQTSDILFSAATYYLGFMTVIIWPLLFLLFFIFGGKRKSPNYTVTINQG